MHCARIQPQPARPSICSCKLRFVRCEYLLLEELQAAQVPGSETEDHDGEQFRDSLREESDRVSVQGYG